MTKLIRQIAAVLAVVTIFSLCGCTKKADPKNEYPKENAAGTNYGTAKKSSLYIDDFYFLTKAVTKATVEVIVGSANLHVNNDQLKPVYTLENGDTIALTYNSKSNRIDSAVYTYSKDVTSENFFNILVELGILKSASSEVTEENNTDIPNNQVTSPGTTDPSQTPSQIQPGNQVTQGEVFASGTYNLETLQPLIEKDMTRATVIASIGRPNFFFSHTFSQDSYIIDCYNLDDGSKLYLDYGFERTNLRCAAVYKNGTVTSVFDIPWSEQKMPVGYTRNVVDVAKVQQLKKNMTPSKVYAYLGEPSWYEGTRAEYKDVFKLSDGTFAYANFGSAHNKLTSLSIKGADGSIEILF